MPKLPKNQTQETFEIGINEHGYSFQQSVLQLTSDLYNQRSGWGLVASEMPVEVRGKGTRIDIVLRRDRQNFGGLFAADRKSNYLIGECKRVNPAFCDWCFAKAPYRFRGQFEDVEPRIFQQVRIRPDEPHNLQAPIAGIGNTKTWATFNRKHLANADFYHIAVALKADKIGNKFISSRDNDAIEGAASQLFQGLSGMVNYLARHESIWKSTQPVTLVPVIFTTANLFVSNADLSKANISTGDLTFEDHELKQVPWLYYQYSLTPNLTHQIPLQPVEEDLSELLMAESLRTVIVANSAGIEDFLFQSTAWEFYS